jgi:hypothetical protein
VHDQEVDVDRDGSAPNARPATDAEPPLQRTVLLPILPRCPDEHPEDDTSAEQCHHGKQDSERNGHGSDCSRPDISANELAAGVTCLTLAQVERVRVQRVRPIGKGSCSARPAVCPKSDRSQGCTHHSLVDTQEALASAPSRG